MPDVSTAISTKIWDDIWYDGIQCDKCDKWFHAACEYLTNATYHWLSKSDEEWVCTSCCLPPFSDSFFNSEPEQISTTPDVSSLLSASSDFVPMKVQDVMKKDCMFICHLNVRSLVPAIDEICEWFSGHTPNGVIFGCSETWLHDAVSDGVISLPGFHLFRRDRGSRGRGVALYYSEDVRCTRRYDHESKKVEAIWAEMKISRKTTTLICCLYRAPDSGIWFLKSFLIWWKGQWLKAKKLW